MTTHLATDELAGLEAQGRFREAAAAANRALEDPALPPEERRRLTFECDRPARIKRDFPFTQDGLFAALRGSLEGLTAEEYGEWIAQGRFDCREIDGERRFMVSSVPNLYFRFPELNARRLVPRDRARLERSHWDTARAIRSAAQARKSPYVLPRGFRVTMTVSVAANAAPARELIRAWLPIPRRYPFQGDFELLSSSSAPKHIADDLSPIRSLYFEQPAAAHEKTIFSASFAYTIHGIRFDLDAAESRPSNPHAASLAPYLAEAPHVRFTPELRSLSSQIVGEEVIPCLKARRCYDWIGAHIAYSYAVEYSTIRNISDYCLRRGYGDCGQGALLFIALCRLNGIPARWQSGWKLFPDETIIHDWAEIYLAPWGWVPVDPYMAVYATRYATSLSPEQRLDLRDFYFGGLDHYRMAVNCDHSQPLTPSKHSIRSDDVDFQRGELECGNRNLYFDQFTYGLTVQESGVPSGLLPAAGAPAPDGRAPGTPAAHLNEP